MKHFCFFLMAIVLLVSQGCSNYPVKIKAMEEFKAIEKNNVTMMRNYNFVGGGIHYWPLVNGEEVGAIYSKEYVSFKLDSGNYELGVRCYDAIMPTSITDEITVSILKNTSKYFLLSPYVLGCAEIEEIDKGEALKRMNKSKRINTGYISDCQGNSLEYKKDDYGVGFCVGHILP